MVFLVLPGFWQITSGKWWQVVEIVARGEKVALGMYNDLYVCNCAPTYMGLFFYEGWLP